MNNDTAIILYKEKLIVFKFCDEIFVKDLTKGDLEDSWDSIMTEKGVIYDTNFHMEDETQEAGFCLYDVKELEDGTFEIDTSVEYPIEIVREIGTKKQYFK